MGQYYLCVVLIIFLFILLIHELIYDYKSIRRPYKRILLCLVLTLLFKYNYGTHFYGLEMRMLMFLVFVLGNSCMTYFQLLF